MKLLNNLTRYLIYVLLIFTPLAQGAVHGWAITAIHLITLVALTSFLQATTISWTWKSIKIPHFLPVMILFIFNVVSLLHSINFDTSFWALALLSDYIVIFYLIICTTTTRAQLRQLVHLIIFIATFLSVFGLFKWGGANPFPWWEYHLGYNKDMLSSTYGNHNHLAGYMEMAIPMALGLFLTGLKKGRFIFMSVLTLTLFSALILSQSRGGWIGSFAGLSFLVIVLLTNRYFKKKRLLSALATTGIVIVLVVLSSTPVVTRILSFEQKTKIPNFRDRVIVWKAVSRAIPDKPLLGTGPGTFATVFTQYQPPGFAGPYYMAHNDYLQFIIELGLPLIALIVWMAVILYRRGFSKLKNPSRLVRGVTLGALSGITAILIHS
ncbi:MAG: O-antigen ligase family protein, partial [Desulfobacterales bacterium]